MLHSNAAPSLQLSEGLFKHRSSRSLGFKPNELRILLEREMAKHHPIFEERGYKGLRRNGR